MLGDYFLANEGYGCGRHHEFGKERNYRTYYGKEDGFKQLEMIDLLLQRAAKAAQALPKLDTMVIWYGDFGHANAFIYKSSPSNSTSITFRGTWSDFYFHANTIRAWQAVADKFNNGILRVGYESLACHKGDILSHGDAIFYLNLPCKVISRISINQIRREIREKVSALEAPHAG